MPWSASSSFLQHSSLWKPNSFILLDGSVWDSMNGLERRSCASFLVFWHGRASLLRQSAAGGSLRRETMHVLAPACFGVGLLTKGVDKASTNARQTSPVRS